MPGVSPLPGQTNKETKMKRLLPLLLLSFSLSAHGALNKWVDSDGNVHYSDGPPPPEARNKVLTPPKAPANAGKSYVEREAEWKKTQKAKQEAEQQASMDRQNAETRKRNCAGAQANLKTFESTSPLTTYNEKGETVTMDTGTRQRNIEEAKKQIGEFCD